jgi:hypothetical protein
MGSNNLPPEEPHEPPGGDGEALEGEVVPYGFLPDDGRYSRPFNGRNHAGNWGTAHLDEDDIAEVIAQWARGVPCRVIGEKYGISRETVRRWGKTHVDRKIQETQDVARKRADVLVQFETISREAWKMYAASTHPMVKKDALARVESAHRAIARLTGAEAPIKLKAEVEVTEIDPTEIKLREMINEAQAKAANTRAAVEHDFKSGTS